MKSVEVDIIATIFVGLMCMCRMIMPMLDQVVGLLEYKNPQEENCKEKRKKRAICI